MLLGLCAVSAVLVMPAFSDPEAKVIRYAAIGDSYSIGEGASEAESWPALLARHLHAEGLDIKLVANPSRTGWTTRDAIDSELPVFIKARPDFATLQIGVNDWVAGADAGEFEKRLAGLMDSMLALLPDKSRLLVVTIPDFSVTPAGAEYGSGRDISKGIAEFNAIIVKQAKLRNLKVADVYELSRAMRDDKSLVATDGLHPSAKEYAAWEKMIFPLAFDLLKAGN